MRRLCTGALAAIVILASSCGGSPAAPRATQRSVESAAGDARGLPTRAPSALDVDGDGKVSPYSDALLILRHTSGFEGKALTENAVGPGCTRCTAAEISAYIESL